MRPKSVSVKSAFEAAKPKMAERKTDRERMDLMAVLSNAKVARRSSDPANSYFTVTVSESGNEVELGPTMILTDDSHFQQGHVVQAETLRGLGLDAHLIDSHFQQVRSFAVQVLSQYLRSAPRTGIDTVFLAPASSDTRAKPFSSLRGCLLLESG